MAEIEGKVTKTIQDLMLFTVNDEFTISTLVLAVAHDNFTFPLLNSSVRINLSDVIPPSKRIILTNTDQVHFGDDEIFEVIEKESNPLIKIWGSNNTFCCTGMCMRDAEKIYEIWDFVQHFDNLHLSQVFIESLKAIASGDQQMNLFHNLRIVRIQDIGGVFKKSPKPSQIDFDFQHFSDFNILLGFFFVDKRGTFRFNNGEAKIEAVVYSSDTSTDHNLDIVDKFFVVKDFKLIFERQSTEKGQWYNDSCLFAPFARMKHVSLHLARTKTVLVQNFDAQAVKKLENRVWQVVGKSYPLHTQFGDHVTTRMWLTVKDNKQAGGGMHLCLKDGPLFPLIGLDCTYDVYVNGNDLTPRNKAYDVLMYKTIQQMGYFLPAETYMKCVNNMTGMVDVMSIEDGLSYCKKQGGYIKGSPLVSIQGTIIDKFLIKHNLREDQLRKLDVEGGYGFVDHKVCVLKFESQAKGELCVYLTDWESRKRPQCLLPGFEVIVRNLYVVSSTGFKCTMLTTFDTVGGGGIVGNMNRGSSDNDRFRLMPSTTLIANPYLPQFIRLAARISIRKFHTFLIQDDLRISMEFDALQDNGTIRVVVEPDKGKEFLILLMNLPPDEHQLFLDGLMEMGPFDLNAQFSNPSSLHRMFCDFLESLASSDCWFDVFLEKLTRVSNEASDKEIIRFLLVNC